MKKILLLGASGQLGWAWQTYLTNREQQGWLTIPYTSSQLDITRFDEVKHELEKQQPDFVINCAAYTAVDKAEEEQDKAMLVNAGAVKNLAGLCKRLDIELVHFSTDYIFAGKKEDQNNFPSGYPEDHPVVPVNWYGQTKWEGEQAIRKSGCCHLIMRVSWLCGTYGNNFVKTMLQLAKTNDEVSVVDDQTGSPTFAASLVEAAFTLLKNKKEGTYHFASQGMISWADFAEAIFYITGKNTRVKRIPSSEYKTRAARPFYSKLDTTAIEQIEGIAIENWKDELDCLLKKITHK